MRKHRTEKGESCTKTSFYRERMKIMMIEMRWWGETLNDMTWGAKGKRSGEGWVREKDTKYPSQTFLVSSSASSSGRSSVRDCIIVFLRLTDVYISLWLSLLKTPSEKEATRNRNRKNEEMNPGISHLSSLREKKVCSLLFQYLFARRTAIVNWGRGDYFFFPVLPSWGFISCSHWNPRRISV